MKAAVYVENGGIILSDIPAPEPGNDKGALIKVLGCGLCGSDIVKINKNLVPTGTVLGHEVVGIVKELNTSIDTDINIGDRVSVAHHVPCFKCRYCLNKNYSMCETFKKTNLVPGGFAEYTFISEQHLQYNTVKVPPEVSNIQASLMEPLGCVLRAVDLANIQPHQNVLVVGLGFIGLLFVQVLKQNQCNVIGCDLIQERIAIASNLGADFAFISDDISGSLESINNKINFEGVDVVVLASGSNNSIDMACKAVRDGGKIVVFASIPDEQKGFINNQIYYRELTVLGAYSSAPQFLTSAMNFISHDKINVAQYCDVLNIDQINLAIEKTLNHQSLKVFFEL